MKFNAKVWSASMNPPFVVTNGEVSLACYLAQFAHKEKGKEACGGAPGIKSGAIYCTVCMRTWRWLGPLGEAIRKLPFKSLVIGAK